MIERYGIAVGRLWLAWPTINLRDLWIGVYIKPAYWEGGQHQQVVYICPLPGIVLLVQWTRGERP